MFPPFQITIVFSAPCSDILLWAGTVPPPKFNRFAPERLPKPKKGNDFLLQLHLKLRGKHVKNFRGFHACNPSHPLKKTLGSSLRPITLVNPSKRWITNFERLRVWKDDNISEKVEVFNGFHRFLSSI